MAGDGSAPKASLQLDWVFGYRGHQCRNNLVYNKSNEFVYFVAGVGVVYDVSSRRQRFYLGHNDDIVSLALHPDGILVATGQVGKNPFACVWNSQTLETVSILKDGHTHGISNMAFSRDGNKLVSIGSDPNNQMNLWEWKKGKSLATARGHTDRIFDVQFCPSPVGSQSKQQPSKFLLVTCGIKHIKFWTHSGNTMTSKKGIFGKTGEIQTMLSVAFLHESGSGDAMTTFASTMSGDVYVWKDNELTRVVREAHNGAIYSIINYETGFMTGGKDGCLRIWESGFEPIRSYDLTKALPIGQEGLVIRSLSSANGGKKVVIGTVDSSIIEFTINSDSSGSPFIILMEGHSEGELWGLAVHDWMFATGSDDKTIRLWNLKTNSAIAKKKMEHGIRSCSFNRDGSSLAVGMLNGSFAVLKTSDLKVQKVTKDRVEVIHELKYSPDGRFLAVGCNDNFVDVYDSSESYKKVGTCTGNSSFITHLDWSTDGRYIVTNSGAAERLIYSMPSGKRVTNSEEIKSITWSTFTGVLGDEVKGIWEKYTDTNDVNATDVNGDVIVTADDFGLVKLFTFPSFKKGAKHKKYNGHSAHVTNCRFTTDKSSVLSIGGADHSIFKWSFIPAEGTQKKAPTSARSAASTGGRADTAGSGQKVQAASWNDGTSDDDRDFSDSSSSVGIDSDVEKENERNYERVLSKQEVSEFQKKSKKDFKSSKGKNPAPPDSLASVDAASTNEKKGPPEASLRLAYAHGYRGFDCRCNLFYLQSSNSGQVVYHTAAVGVVLEKEKNVQSFYLGHDDDIISLAIHPIKNLVATGQVGKNPTIHVWDAETMKTLSILKDQHNRGVCALDFSSDGKTLASVGLDDDHCIVIWNWRKGEKLASTRGHKDKIYMIKWSPHEADRLVSVGNKHIKFWNQAGNGFTSKRGLFGNVSKIDTMLCVAYGKAPGHCFTGSSSGLVHCWVDTNLTRVVPGHVGPIFTIHSTDGNSFVTGGKDGTVVHWNASLQEKLATFKIDLKSSKPSESATTVAKDAKVAVVKSAVMGAQGRLLVGTKDSEIIEVNTKTGSCEVLVQGHGEGELWGLAVHPVKPFFATVSDDCCLKLWSAGSNPGLVSSKNLGKPSRAVSFSHDGKLLAVGSRDGSFVVMETSTLAEKAKVHKRKENISDIKFSPGVIENEVTLKQVSLSLDPGKYLAVASHDNFVDIYNVQTSQHVGVCKGPSSYVTHLDWDTAGKLIQVNSGASECLYFEAPRGTRQVPSAGEVDRHAWHTWTCVLGPRCQGIWPPGSDITDVNAASLTRGDGSLMATGDDFGFVKLFNFPAKGKHAKYKKYIGHSAHVTNVRWTFDDQSLISVGGADASILVWQHVNNKGADFSSVQDNGSDLEIRSGREVYSSRESLTGSDARASKEVKSSRETRSSREMRSSRSNNDVGSGGVGGVGTAAVSRSNQNHVNSEDSDSGDDDGDASDAGGGYDSDVQRECDLDYVSKFNLDPIRNKPPTASPLSSSSSASNGSRGGSDKMKSYLIESVDYLHSRRAGKSGKGQTLTQMLSKSGPGMKEEIKGLKLTSVLGYRGTDGRNNVQYLDEASEIVYHTAGAGVVCDLRGGMQRFYLGHRDDIISLATNRSPRFKGVVATGEIGQRPTIHVWDSKTMSVSSILSGALVKGVGSLSFACSGKLLLAVGIDERNTIVVYDWLEGTQLASTVGSDRRIFQAEYRPDSDSSFVTVGVCHLKFWSLAGSAIIGKKASMSSSGAATGARKKLTFLSIAFGTNGVTYTGSITGDIYVWKEGTLARTITSAHDGPIFTMFTTLTDGLVVTGAKDKHSDGQVKLWDQELKRSKSYKIPNGTDNKVAVVKSVSRVRGKIIAGTKDSRLIEISEKSGEIRQVASYHGDGELWGLAGDPKKGCFATSSDDGYLKIWEAESGALQASHYTGPSRTINYSSSGLHLACGLNNGSFLILSVKDFKCLAKRRDRGSSVTIVRFSPQDQYLVVATQEKCLDVYDTTLSDNSKNKEPASIEVKKLITINLVDSIAISVDFSKDGRYIRVGTDKCTNRIFETRSAAELSATSSLMERIEFQSWTSISGPEMQGAWPKGDTPKNFINCACRSKSETRVVTGDDYGQVKLHEFPVSPENIPTSYIGHSAHVTNVIFTFDDSHVVSIGGDDSSIFIWKCI